MNLSNTSLYLTLAGRAKARLKFVPYNFMSGDNSIVVPPDPIPNSEVKRNRADGSVGSPHVRVGHRQTPNKMKNPQHFVLGIFRFNCILTCPLSHGEDKESERREAQSHVE